MGNIKGTSRVPVMLMEIYSRDVGVIIAFLQCHDALLQFSRRHELEGKAESRKNYRHE